MGILPTLFQHLNKSIKNLYALGSKTHPVDSNAIWKILPLVKIHSLTH